MRNSKDLLGIFLATLMLVLSLGTPAAVKGGSRGKPWRGEPGVKESVASIMARERAAAKTRSFRIREQIKPGEDWIRQNILDNPKAPSVSRWPPVKSQAEGASIISPLNPQTVGANFLGVQIGNTPGWIPPDSMGAVGPTQVVVIVNGRVRVFDKSGNLGALDADTDDFFSSVRGGSSTSDPHVRYDRLSQRWFIVMINVSTPNRVLLAVSSGPVITSSSSFTFFQFQHDLVGTQPNSDTGGFADYPTLGVDAQALYIGVNVFNAAGTALLDTTGFVVRKSDLIAGSLTVTAFRQIGAAGGTGGGPWTPQGVDNDDPNATEGYFIGVDNAYWSLLDILRVTDPGGTPGISAPLAVTVPTTDYPQTVPALGSRKNLDGLDDRLFAASIHKNKVTGIESLWTAHNIEVNSSGVASSSGGRDAARWYELRDLTGTPTLYQAGTLFDSASKSPTNYWMPSVAMSGQGHVALGCSVAGSNEHAEIAVAGRFSGDGAGAMQAPTVAQVTTATYNVQKWTTQRWGDFSQTVVDPTDDMTMWTFQEYCNSDNSWGVRAIQLKAPPPASPATASPSSVCQGESSASVVITGNSLNGSGFFDPGSDSGGPGYPNHISASVGGIGISVNAIAFTDPTHITLSLTISPDAATGSRSVTVTNPDGQSVTATALLTVESAPAEVTSAGFCTGDATCLNWTGVSGATGYSVYQGDPADLPNLVSGSQNSCLRWNGTGTTTGTGVLSQTPAAGTFYWYLVVADTNSCQGPAGQATDGPRILNSSGSCP